MVEGGGEGEASKAWVFSIWLEGEGDLDIHPEAMSGLPIERRTVSNVRSIFRRERVSSSCFLDERLPLFDSSNIHSCPPARHRLQGGPCSAPTHFILRRRHTIQALNKTEFRNPLIGEMKYTNRDPLVVFAFLSSFSPIGL